MCTNTLQPRRVRQKKTENDCLPFWFYGESIQTSVHGLHIVIVEQQVDLDCVPMVIAEGHVPSAAD